MLSQVDYYKNKFLKNVYFEYKPGFTVASVNVEKTDSHDPDETDPGSSWPRKFFFSKKGEVATLIAIQEEEGSPYLMF
jgi:hypothetical protein